MHFHVSALDVFTTWAAIIIFGLLWRTLAARYAHTPFGKAMAFIY